MKNTKPAPVDYRKSIAGEILAMVSSCTKIGHDMRCYQAHTPESQDYRIAAAACELNKIKNCCHRIDQLLEMVEHETNKTEEP